MADHERGPYTPPTDSPLAFESRQPVRGARPFPLTLVISVVVLLGLAAALFVVYRSGVRQAAAPPQDVGQGVGPLNTPAPAGAQPQDPAQGLEIYRSESGQPPQLVPAAPQFTAPPEQPQPRPEAAGPQGAPAAAPALRPAQPASPPVTTAPPPAKAEPAPKPAKAEPAPKPAPKPPEKPAPKPAPAARAGTAAVQIGAVSSTQLADQVWNQAVAVAPGLAAGKGKGVEKLEKDGKVLYRTSVTGFASRAEAQAFCAKLKAAGKACFVK